MYRFTLLSFVIFLAFWGGSPVYAQISKPYPYLRTQADVANTYPALVKVNILSPLWLTANFGYEKFLNPTKSVQMGVYYSNFNMRENRYSWANLPVARYQSFGITPEFRFYLGSRGRPQLNGWFLAPFARFTYTKAVYQESSGEALEGNSSRFKATIGVFRLGTVGGYKYILNDRLSLEAFVGPSVRVLHWYSANNGKYSKKDFLRFPLSVRAGLTLGYAF